jgi:NhaP-type Na+/H+ or K+/H+ antiporter
MAGPMVLGSTFLTGLATAHILGYKGETFPFSASLLLGSICSATDPVAVVALLKELGASKRLATMIEGESLLNDGTAMVVFLILLKIVEGEDMSFGSMILMFVRLSFGGPLLGIIAGFIMSLILKRIHNNFVLEVNTTIVGSYLVFFIAESTALHISGILAIVALGLYMTRSGKTRISAESEHSVHHVWGYIGYMAETVIFILAGVILGQRLSQDTEVQFSDYLLVLANYLILHVIRFVVIILFWPILRKLGYGLDFKQVILCSYAGLRGAVGLALALMVTNSQKVPKYI